MGFDILYLPPIHPIGVTHRKGRNNTLTPTPSDPGVPWAIGGADGGHMAINPALGTMKDFEDFVAVAKKNKIEVALDFALQASPDHLNSLPIEQMARLLTLRIHLRSIKISTQLTLIMITTQSWKSR
jgi:hypothetical protein